MRILHTADWHFGKTLEGRDRAAEQWQFVDELVALCEDERIDLVLMAGDVYQTVNPSAEAEAMFYRALDGLSAGGARGVVIIAGNHDHAERIAAARPLADQLGMTLAGLPKDRLTTTPAQDGRVSRVAAGVGYVELAILGCAERAVIALVPYPSEGRLNEVLAQTLDEQELQVQYNRRIAAWFSSLAAHYRPDTVNLAVSHLYVAGGLESDSEVQIQMGGAYAVTPDVFPA
ncbi:MAG: exonuclease subunit SbcD, partial [Alicyclobacillus sp.]|nr:exonuclease subunit SbcD [Alicyclobacillus sp.]